MKDNLIKKISSKTGTEGASELSNVNTLAANSATAGDRHRRILLCITHMVLRMHWIRWSIRAWMDRVVKYHRHIWGILTSLARLLISRKRMDFIFILLMFIL